MSILYFILELLVLLAVIAGSIVKVPTAYYGVETFFGKRTGRKFKEGLHLKIPFFGKVLFYSMSLKTYTFDGEESIIVLSSDGLEISIEGAAQIRPSFNNLLGFVEIPESTILDGMKDAMEGGLGIVAGQEEGTGFIGYRKEIEYIINCVFCLERRPDYYLNGTDMSSDSFDDYLQRLRDAEVDEKKIAKLESGNWEIPLKPDGSLHVLNFYRKNIRRIEIMLQLENMLVQNSKIENQYCIEIESFKMAKVSFSKKTTESLEKMKQAEKDLEASKLRQEMKMRIFNELIANGVPPGQASNDADAMVGIAPKQTVAGGVMPILNI
ncbi:MAG: SPFH domain-containing protein [Candidatus Paceibacterota bacterium]